MSHGKGSEGLLDICGHTLGITGVCGGGGGGGGGSGGRGGRGGLRGGGLHASSEKLKEETGKVQS